MVGDGSDKEMLLVSESPLFSHKVFYVKDGTRHHVLHPEWIADRIFPPDEPRWVDEGTICSYRLGAPVPLNWSDESRTNPPDGSSTILREIMTSRLTGSGVEFGAGHNPFPVPLECQVQYADRLSGDRFRSQYHGGREVDVVAVDMIADMEDMGAIPDESLDFIIAAHVIEHTRNPLRAIEQAHRKLRCGGSLALAVPEMRHTFDRDRGITSLEHLILDYQYPVRERDLLHYIEYFTIADPRPVAAIYATVKEVFEAGTDIHYHVWTYESFLEQVQHVRQCMLPWRGVWSHPSAASPDPGVEFFILLTK
jgi:Methyltransferase domain